MPFLLGVKGEGKGETTPQGKGAGGGWYGGGVSIIHLLMFCFEICSLTFLLAAEL